MKGQGVHRIFLFSFQFCCEPKTAPKKNGSCVAVGTLSIGKPEPALAFSSLVCLFASKGFLNAC